MPKIVAIAVLVLTATVSAGCGATGGDESADPTTTTESAEGTTTTEPDDTTTTEPDDTTTTETDDTTTTEPEPEGGGDVEVDVWAAEFCGNFTGWITALETASTGVSEGLTPGDIEGGKAAIVGLFNTVSDETSSLITSIEAGGAPDIDEGEALVDDLLVRFGDFGDAIDTAEVDAAALPIDDGAAFQSEVNAITTTFEAEITEVTDSFAALDTEYPSADLQSALTESCNF